MINEIQDPNQLTLGIENQVLTVEQIARVEAFKERLTKSNENTKASLLRKQALLLENGFIEGKDFSFSMEEVNEDADVNANGWNDNEVIVTVDVRRVNGKCVLLYDRYEATSDMIVQSIAGFSVELNKVECHTINGNGRWVTFRKLKENLAEKNSSAQWEMSSARNNKSVLSYTAEKYRKLAPGAEVTVSREGASSGRRYYSFDTVTVKFQNGNLLVVAPRRNNDEELVHRFIDVTTANKSAEELVQYLGK
jgi:hypothetical protein